MTYTIRNCNEQESLERMSRVGSHGALVDIRCWRWFSGFGNLPRGISAFFYFGRDATENWAFQGNDELDDDEKLSALENLRTRLYHLGNYKMIRALNRAIVQHGGDDGSVSGSYSESDSGNGSYSGAGSYSGYSYGSSTASSSKWESVSSSSSSDW